MSSWACRSFSERRARKNRGAIATKGSLNEFGWLIFTNVTSQPKVTEILNEIPRRLAPCAFARSPRLNPQKFDKLRMTYSAFVGWYMSKVLRIKNHIKKSTCICRCFWHTMADSNRRHQASEACALSSWANGAYSCLWWYYTTFSLRLQGVCAKN